VPEDIQQLIEDNNALGFELMKAKFKVAKLDLALKGCLNAMKGRDGIVYMEEIKNMILFADLIIKELEIV